MFLKRRKAAIYREVSSENLKYRLVNNYVLGIVNPLRAIFFFRKNTNIYLHFMSFLHNNKTEVDQIPP